MIQIVIADNQPIFRAGTARVLESEPDLCVRAQCGDAAALLETVTDARFTIVLMARSLGADMDRIFAASSATGCRVILMTDTAEEPPPAIMTRLDGLLTRHVTTADLLECVRRVGNGERTVGAPVVNPNDSVSHRMLGMLTPREMQIVGFVVQGYKNRQIAEELGTGEQVVKNYLRSIYDKTGSSDRLELALFTLHHRLLAQAVNKAVLALHASRS